MGQNLGAAESPFFGEGELGPHLTQKNNVTWVEAFLHTKWHHNPSSRLATGDMGRKLGAVPLLGWANNDQGRCLRPCRFSS